MSRRSPEPLSRLLRLRIAVLVESSRSFGRGVLHGLAEEMRRRRNWLVYFQEGGLGELLPRWFHRWQGDGIIARIEDPAMARALQRKRIPMVDIRGVCTLPGVPVVKTDNREIARLAAEHLLSRGYRRFGYCGYGGAHYAEERRIAFAEFIGVAGFACLDFQARGPHHANVRQQEQYGWAHEEDLVAWLRTLPRPIGVMTCNDARGHQLLNAAHRLSLKVPDDVAVVGVDNYEAICDLTVPPLSSVEQNTRQIAAEAVRQLEALLRGERLGCDAVCVKPCRVVARRSTDALAIRDRNLRQAVRFIRERAASVIGVDEVAQQAGLSRRNLERRFCAAFGHSPGQEIIAARMRLVKSLLVETDLPLYRIAEQAGFRHAEYLNRKFKQQTGTTPRTYRLQMQTTPCRTSAR